MGRPPAQGPDFTSHRRAAEDEDVTWLLARGVPLPDACARAGITVEAWEKRRSPARS